MADLPGTGVLAGSWRVAEQMGDVTWRAEVEVGGGGASPTNRLPFLGTQPPPA